MSNFPAIGLELLGPNGLTADNQTGTAFAVRARSISSVTLGPTSPTDSAGNFSVSSADGTGTTWQDDSGLPWLQGGASAAEKLIYTVTGASDANQVVTFTVTDTSGDTVATLYAQVISWSSSGIVFEGFTGYDAATGVLSDPLASQGASSSFFIVGAGNLEGTTSFGLTEADPSTTPDGLGTTDIPIEPSSPFEQFDGLNLSGSPANAGTHAPAVPGITQLGPDGGLITLSAANFATVAVATINTGNGGLPAESYNVSGSTTWQDDSGSASQFWLQGGNADPLTYTLTAGDTATQVITFTVTDTVTGAAVGTFFGQVLAWTNNGSDALLRGFQSYDASTGDLSDPLSGTGAPSFFILSGASLENAVSGISSSQDFQNIVGTGLPFGASSALITDAPSVQLAESQLACFAAGTAIMTPTGPAAVEDLAAGDIVLTASGAAHPVQWVGSSHMRCDRHPTPSRVMPVQVVAGAFGPSLPARDLFLSPEHAIYHDGVMIPVQCLVNGGTIRQVPARAMSYYHVELPQHDVLLAEGLPAESYLDTGNRQAMALSDARGQQVA